MNKTANEVLKPYVEIPFRHTKIVEMDNAIKAMEKYATGQKLAVLNELKKKVGDMRDGYLDEINSMDFVPGDFRLKIEAVSTSLLNVLVLIDKEINNGKL